MTDPKLDLSSAARIADMINAWFCPQCGLRDETMRGIDQDGTCSSCGSDCCTWDSVRGHLAHYGWEVVSADDARELYRIRAEATAALCYEGDCAKMTGRARPCPVHDDQPQLRTREPFAENLTIGGKGARFTPQLKEARRAAARKLKLAKMQQAERERDDARRRYYLEAQERQHRERERDTALARVKELERAQISPDAYMPREELARLGIAQKALADWENGLSEPWRTYVMSLETNANPSGNIRDAFCQRQNAEALAARVKELETELDAALDGVANETTARVAAESALASAREHARIALAYLTDKDDVESTPLHAIGHARTELRALLSSAPSPAPERSDRWNELGELPVTVMATSEYPSPAPCSGCAAVRAIAEAVDKQHGHRCEDTSLVLSELADEVLKVLNG